MPELSAPQSTIKSQSEAAEDKLKGLQKAKMDEERFIQELFAFFQKMQSSSLLNNQFATESQLDELAKDCGYQDLAAALNTAKNPKGQTALVQALQGQEFSLANALLNYGAQYDSKAMAEYDLAIHSERGRQAFQQQTITPPSADKYTPSESDKLHVVKEFGLVLGIEVTAVDGTESQRGHIGPTYNMMTEAVTSYGKETNKEPEKRDFKEISDAFAFAKKEANFQFSTPEGSPEAGKALSNRIKEGKITTVPTSCEGHVMGLSFVPVEGKSDKAYLVFTNRGEGAKKSDHGTQIYEVDKKDITPDFLNKMLNGHDKDISHAEVMAQIHQVTKGKDPVATISQNSQKYDNCTIANTRANIHGVLLCQEANRKGGFENVDQNTKDAVKDRYKGFTDDMRGKKIQQLEKAIKNDPGNPDLINLAKEYVDSKPNSKFSNTLKSVIPDTSEKSISMSSI